MPPNASRPVFVGNSHTPLCKLLMLRRLKSVPPTRERQKGPSLSIVLASLRTYLLKGSELRSLLQPLKGSLHTSLQLSAPPDTLFST